jgi:hypothetical protein
VEALQWAREHGCPCNHRTNYGRLRVCIWQYCSGRGSTTASGVRTNVCASAAQFGQLSTLQWSREHDCPWDIRTCNCAAARGHLKVLVWARVHGCPWGDITCMLPLRTGTWMCCGRRGSTNAHGIIGCAHSLLTKRYGSGR